MKERLDKVLKDNQDLSLKPIGNRDLLVQQILSIIEGKAPGSSTATVMTEAASQYDPKRHGPDGAKPQSL